MPAMSIAKDRVALNACVCRARPEIGDAPSAASRVAKLTRINTAKFTARAIIPTLMTWTAAGSQGNRDFIVTPVNPTTTTVATPGAPGLLLGVCLSAPPRQLVLGQRAGCPLPVPFSLTLARDGSSSSQRRAKQLCLLGIRIGATRELTTRYNLGDRHRCADVCSSISPG